VRAALIGYTGFVGSALARDGEFDLCVNRTNLESLRGAHLKRIVCAGLPAAKWIANQRPAEDADNMRRLVAALATTRADTFTLISTIDVYPRATDADETYECSNEPNHAYGTHRLEFERSVRERFPHAHIVRLPALFGAGLKKNILYDLLYDNQVERINPDSRFQWYPLTRLTRDLRTIEERGLPLVNLFTEPLETRAILEQLFPNRLAGRSPGPRAHYDLHTCHGAVFGGDSRYIMSRAAVLAALGAFVTAERRCQ
jgi:hypothetical protein